MRKNASLKTMARYMTEDELLLAITEAASLLGWRWTHTRRSDKAIIMGNLGFPDLVLAKAGRVLFLELKSDDGHATSDQLRWLEAIGNQEGQPQRALLVRPADLDNVLRLLGAEGRPRTSEEELFAAHGVEA